MNDTISPKDIEEAFEDYKSLVKNDLPEAPVSINIKFWADGYGSMFTLRGDEASKVMSNFEYMLNFIKSKGWKNKWDEPVVAKPTSMPSSTTTAPQICGVHGVPQVWKTGKYKNTTQYHKAGDDYGFWSCTSKNADGSYCNWKPAKKEWTATVAPNPTTQEVVSAF